MSGPTSCYSYYVHQEWMYHDQIHTDLIAAPAIYPFKQQYQTCFCLQNSTKPLEPNFCLVHTQSVSNSSTDAAGGKCSNHWHHVHSTHIQSLWMMIIVVCNGEIHRYFFRVCEVSRSCGLQWIKLPAEVCWQITSKHYRMSALSFQGGRIDLSPLAHLSR